MPTLDISQQVERESVSKRTPEGKRSITYRLFNAARSTFWFFLSSLAAVIALECVFALAHFGEQEYLQIDPLLGLVHLNNKELTWREEGFSRGPINSAGFVDIEHPLIKPAGVFRIAVMGDSFTEALQLPACQRFTNLLQDKLNSDGLRKFEVMNCGISGFGTGQEYLLYLSKIINYRPDMVILCVNQWEPDKNTLWPARPLFSLSKQGKLQCSWTALDAWRASSAAVPFTLFDWARRNSRVWGVVLQAYSDLKNDATFKSICRISESLKHLIGSTGGNSLALTRGASELNAKRRFICDCGGIQMDDVAPLRSAVASSVIDDADAGGDKGPLAQDIRWRVTGNIDKHFAAVCSQQRCILMLVALPVRFQSDPLNEKLALVTRINHSQSIPLLNVIPRFIGEMKNGHNSFFLQGHLSAQGHELVADLLHEFLIEHSLGEHAAHIQHP